MKAISIILTTLLAQAAMATTEFAPVGAKWVYEFESGRAPSYMPGTLIYTSVKDTLIGDIQARKIEGVKTTPIMHTDNSVEKEIENLSPMYAYNQEGKVYLGGEDGKSFQLLFDFDAAEGDTVAIEKMSDECPKNTIFVVDSITKNSEGLKMYWIARFDEMGAKLSLNQYFLENIGCKYNLWALCAMTTSGGMTLKSYTDGTLGLKEISNKAVQILLYPNPVGDVLNIGTDDSPSRTEIYNQVGELILTSSERSINVSTLSHGNYIVIIHMEDGTIKRGQFIK